MKKVRKGFSLQMHTSNEIVDYTVYFEEKGKVIFCYIYDSFLIETFRGKAICHENDRENYDNKIGRRIAFNSALEKRDKRYSQLLRIIVDEPIKIQHHNINIESKFIKFNKEN